MKSKFLELVKAVKETGAIETFSNASNAKELADVFKKFQDDNQELVTKIKEWATEFRKSNSGPIFVTGEELENPMEITAVIRIIGDENVREFEIFEDWVELMDSVGAVGTAFAVAVEKCIISKCIYEITAEDIFAAYEKSEEIDSDAQSETANEECGEDDSGADNEDDAGEEYGEDEIATINFPDLNLEEAEDH